VSQRITGNVPKFARSTVSGAPPEHPAKTTTADNAAHLRQPMAQNPCGFTVGHVFQKHRIGQVNRAPSAQIGNSPPRIGAK
jgi:hypothetical protein